ncbi:hypothetical protein ACM55F_10035 [Flavobacterium sp. XS2P12]|uniref:hypothetical protein n=1 Tax=Flavobacterium melibiosi TaxID=3398734 RepID=UPI003A886B32
MTQTVPQSKRKGELQQLLNKECGFSCHTVKKEIIAVIVEVRKVSLKEAMDTKTVYPKEVEEVLKRFA